MAGWRKKGILMDRWIKVWTNEEMQSIEKKKVLNREQGPIERCRIFER
jgi:hypothetical protein